MRRRLAVRSGTGRSTWYSQVRLSVARLVETVREPRLAVTTTVPEHPCEGETNSGRTSRPLTRKA